MFHQVCLAPGHRHGLLRALIRLWLAHPLAGRSRSKKCPEIFAVPRPWPYFLIFWGYVMPHSEWEHVCSYNNFCARECALLGGVMSQQIPTKKMGSFFDRHIASMGFWGNIQWTWLPSRRVCEPLIKELLSQRSIPLPENIQEAMNCTAKMNVSKTFFRLLSYVIHKRFACIVVLFYGHWLIFGCPGTLPRTCCGYWHFLPLLLCSPPRWTCLVSVLIPTSVVEAFIMGTKVTVAQQDATKTSR